MPEPQAAPSPPEKPPSTAILCNTCGNVCRGEVLRVQNKYFHIQCFICKGEHPGCPHRWARHSPAVRLSPRPQKLVRSGLLEKLIPNLSIPTRSFQRGLPASLLGLTGVPLRGGSGSGDEVWSWAAFSMAVAMSEDSDPLAKVATWAQSHAVSVHCWRRELGALGCTGQSWTTNLRHAPSSLEWD